MLWSLIEFSAVILAIGQCYDSRNCDKNIGLYIFMGYNGEIIKTLNNIIRLTSNGFFWLNSTLQNQIWQIAGRPDYVWGELH